MVTGDCGTVGLAVDSLVASGVMGDVVPLTWVGIVDHGVSVLVGDTQIVGVGVDSFFMNRRFWKVI